jgi:hypothetical protein
MLFVTLCTKVELVPHHQRGGGGRRKKEHKAKGIAKGTRRDRLARGPLSAHDWVLTSRMIMLIVFSKMSIGNCWMCNLSHDSQ